MPTAALHLSVREQRAGVSGVQLSHLCLCVCWHAAPAAPHLTAPVEARPLSPHRGRGAADHSAVYLQARAKLCRQSTGACVR